jgi:cell division protein FtsB
MRARIVRAQLAMLNGECKLLTRDIRRLQHDLNALRLDNSATLERATAPQPTVTSDHDLSVLCDGWLESHCIFQIAGLQFRIAGLPRRAPNPDDEHLLGKLRAENKQLAATRDELAAELRALQIETEREREELRAFLRRNE